MRYCENEYYKIRKITSCERRLVIELPSFDDQHNLNLKLTSDTAMYKLSTYLCFLKIVK